MLHPSERNVIFKFSSLSEMLEITARNINYVSNLFPEFENSTSNTAEVLLESILLLCLLTLVLTTLDLSKSESHLDVVIDLEKGTSLFSFVSVQKPSISKPLFLSFFKCL